MEDVKKFFIENSTQIWTILSVVIGGIVTYIFTSDIERKKNKRAAQKEHLNNVLIPFGICLEKTISAIEQRFQEPVYFLSPSRLNYLDWIEELEIPLKYLSIDKRIFLSRSITKDLEKYKNLVTSFNRALKNDYSNFLSRYHNYVICKLQTFSTVSPFEVEKFRLAPIASTKIKLSIINKTPFSLSDDISVVHFIKKGFEGESEYLSLELTPEIKDLHYSILSCNIPPANIEDKNTLSACYLFKFIEYEMIDEEDILMEFIENTNTSFYLSAITYKLKEINRKLLKEIDKITK